MLLLLFTWFTYVGLFAVSSVDGTSCKLALAEETCTFYS